VTGDLYNFRKRRFDSDRSRSIDTGNLQGSLSLFQRLFASNCRQPPFASGHGISIEAIKSFAHHQLIYQKLGYSGPRLVRMLRSVLASSRAGLEPLRAPRRFVAFDVQRRFFNADAGAEERLEAVKYWKAKLEPVKHQLPGLQGGVLSEILSGLAKYAVSRSRAQEGYYATALERLVLVYRAHKSISTGCMTPCEVGSVTVPAEEHSFTHEEFRGYTDPATSVLLMVNNNHTLVQRGQPSGTLSYMQAPAVVQYYAILHAAQKAGKAAPGHGMLDITYDIAANFSPLQLAYQLLDTKGETSYPYLGDILQPNSQLKPVGTRNDHRSHLRDLGPALVANFQVYSDFLERDVHKHYNVPADIPVDYRQRVASSQYKGRHAMVLVGARVDSSGNHFYLLQNWWKGKQFVEVSQEYFDFCNPSIYYVSTPQTDVPPSRRTHPADVRFAETEAVLEKADELPIEGNRIFHMD
jgi:hypothetical protein